MSQALEVSLILEKFPKSVIDVYTLVIESDGSALAAAISCASVALAAAGIEMYDLVSACTVSWNGENILLDPVAEEEDESNQKGTLTVACMPSLDQITQLFQNGEMDLSKVQEGVEVCLDGCEKIYGLLQASFKAKQNENG